MIITNILPIYLDGSMCNNRSDTIYISNIMDDIINNIVNNIMSNIIYDIMSSIVIDIVGNHD